MMVREVRRMGEIKVPLIDLDAQHALLREELMTAIARVVASQRFILGPEVCALEEEIARYVGTKYAIGCASGSDALLLALMALEVGPGDEVITTPYTFFATASAIVRLGARPVFVDIDPQTYNINPRAIEQAICARTRAIIPVHLFGQCADMRAIQKICARHSIPIIEDAAQAIGAEDDGRRAGSMGAIGCFSFYPTKNLGAMGDGGMLTTNDDALAQRLRMLRAHGAENRYYHRYVGINSRLDELQAAILRVKLKHLDDWAAARRRNAVRYAHLFAEAGLTNSQANSRQERAKVALPQEREGARHVFNQYVVRVHGDRRDAVRARLAERGVASEVYYPVPLHLQECFAYLGYREGSFPEAERAARASLALPIYAELTEEQQRHVVQTVRRALAEAL